jgi:hypothetical protein
MTEHRTTVPSPLQILGYSACICGAGIGAIAAGLQDFTGVCVSLAMLTIGLAIRLWPA